MQLAIQHANFTDTCSASDLFPPQQRSRRQALFLWRTLVYSNSRSNTCFIGRNHLYVQMQFRHLLSFEGIFCFQPISCRSAKEKVVVNCFITRLHFFILFCSMHICKKKGVVYSVFMDIELDFAAKCPATVADLFG